MAQDTFTIHPEDLSGLWEASDGRGGVVGIDLILLTELPVSATSSAGVSQRIKEVEAGVYHRHGPVRFGDEHFFTSESRGGGLRLQGNRLWMPLTADVALNLVRDASGAWTGWMQEQEFNGRVTLRRPAVDRRQKIEGLWQLREPIGGDCLHVGQDIAGAVVAWMDHAQLLGRVRWAPWLVKPAFVPQSYGTLAGVRVTPAGVDLDLDPQAAGGNSRVMSLQLCGRSLLESYNGKERWVRVQRCFAGQVR